MELPTTDGIDDIPKNKEINVFCDLNKLCRYNLPAEWKKIVVVSIYKQKGDVQEGRV